MSRTMAVFAALEGEAAEIGAILREAGMTADTAGADQLLRGVETADFGAAIVTWEALAGVALEDLREAIARQPGWSDFPFVVLGLPGQEAARSPLAEVLGNLTYVDRPIQPHSLVNCARSALRARLRQHEMRSLLDQQQQAERQISELALGLERGVSERTAELERANARLELEMGENRAAQAELRELQARLSHVSRLSAANSMASMIAHELNQPLAATVAYLHGAERLLRAEQASKAVLEAVRAAVSSAHRAGAIIRHLRKLVSSGQPAHSRESLRAIIASARSLALLGLAADAVEFTEAIDEDADAVAFDRVQMEQVFGNLLRNAIEAMADSPRRALHVAASRRGARVEVELRDSGPGFAQVPDLTVPSFRSTKPGGLGIGLPICRTIVEAHGGSFAAHNAPEGGARVVFTLPAASES